MKKSRIIYLIIISAVVFSISCKGNLFNEGMNSPDNADSGSNTSPVADDKIVTTTVDIQVNITLTASDADEHALNWQIDTEPSHGDLTGSAPDLVYTPENDYTGSDNFTFHVNDGFDDSNTATVTISIQAQGSWNESDMGFTVSAEQNHIAVGDGRGDGVMRVYSTTNQIHEYTFNDTNWDEITFGDDFLTNSGIAIGDVRNDFDNRAYITKYSVHEHYYDTDTWAGGWVRSSSIIDDGLIIGDGRNDGVKRIYFVDREAVYELSYNLGDWDLFEVDSADSTYAKLVITEGRNDGIKRLYAAIDDHVYEYTWLGSSWGVLDCGEFIIYNSLYSICAGNARNDGKNRIYTTGQYMSDTIFELSYNGEDWQHVILKDNISVNIITIGRAKNDGLNYLYTANSSGVGEYFYDGTWSKISNIETPYEVNGIAIGNGRNDDVNRIYVTGDDNHIYEYSYE